MSPNRSTIDTFSRKGKRDYVRVVREVVDGAWKIRVLWKDTARRAETFDDTRNGLQLAKAFADAKHESLKPPAAPPVAIAPLTARELHERYILAKESEWAPNTLRLSNERWGKFELYVGRDRIAGTVARDTLDGLKKALLTAGHSPNQVKHVLKEVVREYTWAVEWDVVPPTKLSNYTVKFTKAARRTAPQMAEYSRDERDRLLAAMDPRDRHQWRPWVLTTLFAFCGPRQHAAMHLEIDDVELTAPGPEFGGRIRWRAETNKTDTDWWQPLPGPVAEALWVAMGWRQGDGYGGRYVFYGVQRRTRGQSLKRRDQHHSRARTTLEGVSVDEKPWTYSAYNAQLHAAERRSGVATIKYRAAHGHRRGVAGDVHAATGSLRAAADWLGDKSTKVIDDHYVLTRAEELRKTAQTVVVKRTEMQRPASEGGSDVSKLSESNIHREPAVGIEPTTARSQDEG